MVAVDALLVKPMPMVLQLQLLTDSGLELPTGAPWLVWMLALVELKRAAIVIVVLAIVVFLKSLFQTFQAKIG